MSTYEIIVLTVVVTLVVVWFVTDSDWARKRKSEQQDGPAEWERYEQQQEMMEGNDRRHRHEAQEQERMKIIAARISEPRNSEVRVTTEDGVEHSVPFPSDLSFVAHEWVGVTLEEARDKYAE